METKVKNYLWLIGLLSFLGGAIAYIYNEGVKESQREVRMFRDADERIETVNYVKSADSPVELKQRSIFDSLETVRTNEMLEKLVNDSKSVKKHIHHLDSINLLTSDQVYQLNQKINNR